MEEFVLNPMYVIALLAGMELHVKLVSASHVFYKEKRGAIPSV